MYRHRQDIRRINKLSGENDTKHRGKQHSVPDHAQHVDHYIGI